uniref:Uncharacterized protein n=1 Tax=viral metagenome TaxID=1070528 RepID=A0A6C0C6D3_9ZZZZ
MVGTTKHVYVWRSKIKFNYGKLEGCKKIEQIKYSK